MPGRASLYASSTCRYLRPLASAFGQGLRFGQRWTEKDRKGIEFVTSFLHVWKRAQWAVPQDITEYKPSHIHT